MSPTQSRCFSADLSRFHELREYIERLCSDSGVSHDAAGRLLVVLEELFANTVQHGYSRVPKVPDGNWVWIALNFGEEGVEVVYEDAAPEYDPFARTSTPDYSGASDSWQVGGVGVALVVRLGRKLTYARAEGRNRIGFLIPARRSGA